MQLQLKYVCVLFLCLYSFTIIAQDKSKPNVLFVAFDDLKDWQGVLAGHPQAYTPNIDRLAKRGVLFSNAHEAGTMCCPSRASVMTGLRPTSTGIYKNSDNPLELYKNEQSINDHFKESGYYVAGAGKILHKFHYEENQWDEFVGRHKPKKGYLSNKQNPDKNNIHKLENSSISWGSFDAPDSLTFDAQSVQWVSDRINQKHDKPFFLACGIYRPHIPWFNPKTYFDMHPLAEVKRPNTQESDLSDVPFRGKNIAFSTSNFTNANDLENDQNNAEHEAFKKNGQWSEAVQAYLASISYADAQFGKLLDALDASPYAENTIIVLWSDHGWHLGEKEHWRKATLWEEVTRVPLIISGPGISKNKECKTAVSLIDIFPSLIDLCNLDKIEKLDGQSLVPQLQNAAKKRNQPAISSITPTYHAIRNDRYRYISYGDGQEELYDHNTDTQEWSNIAKNRSSSRIIRKLRKYLPANGLEPVIGEDSDKEE
ncbi:Arylsulfatase A [Spirosomataceae bacterium TFI 002]|nr:Arylsulfatase A [Spirosomataceae bacterium TFI 002]